MELNSKGADQLVEVRRLACVFDVDMQQHPFSSGPAYAYEI